MDKDGLTGELLARMHINLDYFCLLLLSTYARATQVIAHVHTISDLFAVLLKVAAVSL